MKRYHIEYLEKNNITTLDITAHTQGEAVRKLALLCKDGVSCCIKIKQV